MATLDEAIQAITLRNNRPPDAAPAVPEAINVASIRDMIAKLTNLTEGIDEQEAITILAQLEAVASIFASGRWFAGVLGLLSIARAIAEAKRSPVVTQPINHD